MSCWHRWLAYAAQAEEKFYVSDYDAININFPITKPSDKYEEELEEELEEDDTTGTTYNVNVSNKSADPNYTDDGMGMFESILRNNIMKYKNR